MNPHKSKADWRRLLTELRTSIPENHRAVAHRACSAHLHELILPARDTTVSVYAATDHEVDPAGFIETCWKMGSRVVFPVTRFENRTCLLTFCPVSDWESLQLTRRGIREPTGTQPVDPSEIDVMVIPGLGFDQNGTRMGYGAGCYDRFLANPALKAIRIGIAYASCVVDHLPAESHDQAMHFVVTDQGITRIIRPQIG